jgi:hypothetical protein
MSETFESNLERIRGKRQFIVRCANELLERTEYSREKLSVFDWNSLMSMPPWCLLSAKARAEVRDACGATYLAPLIRKSINGQVVQQFRDEVGEQAFEYLFSVVETSEIPVADLQPFVTQRSIGDLINAAGSSVLLATLVQSDMRDVYVGELGARLRELELAHGSVIYQQARELLLFIHTSSNRVGQEDTNDVVAVSVPVQ